MDNDACIYDGPPPPLPLASYLPTQLVIILKKPIHIVFIQQVPPLRPIPRYVDIITDNRLIPQISLNSTYINRIQIIESSSIVWRR